MNYLCMMKTNIETTNISKHFFMDEPIGYEKGANKYKNKLTKFGFHSMNEIDISKKIKQLPHYLNNYLVVEEYRSVNINHLNNNQICDKINTAIGDRYLMLKYKNQKLSFFNDYLVQFTEPKLFIMNVVCSVSYISKGLVQLNKNGICFFDLSSQNIVFNLDIGEKPVIFNFKNSLQIDKLDSTYIANVLTQITDYTYKPLEVHILFYLIKNDISFVSYSFIEEVCERFVSNLSVLSFFPEKIIAYKALCVETLSKYINVPKKEVIVDILTHHDKWDTYSISVLYLHLFGTITNFFSLKQNFISQMKNVFYKNIHPDPSKRETIFQFFEKYEELFNDQIDWSFVKKLPTINFNKLHEIMNK